MNPYSPERIAELRSRVMDGSASKTATEWWARREILDMLAFIRDQVELWDNDGDSGFPLYEHGKRILARYSAPSAKLSRSTGNKGETNRKLFDRCVVRYYGGRSIRCCLGLWAVSAPDKDTAEREARHYWRQYFADGEYQDHLSNSNSDHPK